VSVKAISGYVGVINGVPVFEDVSDDKGEMRSFDVYKTKEMAFARWDHVRRVRIIIDQKNAEIPNRGKL
jgi:peroxiredoxin